MATNVLELRRPDRENRSTNPLDELTIQTCADVANAALALDRQARSHGFQIMAWHDLASMNEMVDVEGRLLNTEIFGWNDDQLEPFRDIQKAVNSPILRACRVESEPFLISSQTIRARWTNRYLSMIEAEDFELKSSTHAAIVVPIHLPFGQIATAIFTNADATSAAVSHEFDQFGDHLGSLARRFISGYVKVSCDPRYLPTESTLTPRQIECLRWAALGKTDYEIAIILGCTHAGVRYHIARACERLESTNRTQSVFRACQLGYIGYDLRINP